MPKTKEGIEVPVAIDELAGVIYHDETTGDDVREMKRRMAPYLTEWSGPSPTFVGADPGANGAIVWFAPTGVVCIPLGKRSDREVWEEIRFIPPGSVVVAEKNTGYIGGEGNTGSSQFKFGVSYGKLLGWFIAAGLRIDEQQPKTWQKFLGIASREHGQKQMVPRTKGKLKGIARMKEVGGESPADFKRRLKQMAERLYATSIVLETADAHLIALYCQRKWEGKT